MATRRPWGLIAAGSFLFACTRGDSTPTASSSATPSPDASATSAWKPPAEPAWPELPRDDGEVTRLVGAEAPHTVGSGAHLESVRTLRADATPLVAGEDEIAAALDAWLRADSKHPAYVVFGTTHDSRAQLDVVRAIVSRMKSPWALALEQFRTAGHWKNTPEIVTADDTDLATFGSSKNTDDSVLWRLRDRQARFDHAAWKYGYLPAMIDLLYAARGASVPIVGCDMPPELHAGISNDATLSSLRELHCARSLRSQALTLATAHQPDGGLDEDDPAPPERFAVLLGRDHADGGFARFLPKDARVRTVQVFGARARGVLDEEQQALAPSFVVTDPVMITVSGNVTPVTPVAPLRRHEVPTGDAADVLLLPDEVWGGDVDRASDRGASPGPAGDGLPDRNVLVSSDDPATFALADARVQIASKPEWLSVRSGHQGYVLGFESKRFVGAVDVPATGYVEVHFTPKQRALRVILHAP